MFDKVGFLNENLVLASDFELWTRFAEHAELYSLNTILAAFRSHETQMSSDIQKYMQECDEIKPIKFKFIIRFFGKIFYLFSILSPKNKIIITKHGALNINKKWFYFE